MIGSAYLRLYDRPFTRPLLAVALRSARLFALGLVPNLLPPIFALGFMGWAGIA